MLLIGGCELSLERNPIIPTEILRIFKKASGNIFNLAIDIQKGYDLALAVRGPTANKYKS